MLNNKYPRSQTFLLGAAAVVSLVAGGCYKTEPIRTYSAPKESAPVAKQEAPAATPGEPTDRMLAAILPVGGQAYFFKVMGPIPAVEKHEKAINEFFAAIRVGDDGKPKWQVPNGWQEGASKPMRMATLEIPGDGKPLEVAISALPWPGNEEAMLSNVNRWRKQLQLPEVDAAHVGENSREIKIGDKPMTIVDLRGRAGSSGMMPPFAGGAGGSAPMLPGAGGGQMPAGHPPIDGGAAAGTPPAASPHGAASPQDTPPATASVPLPKFTAPADWKEEPATGMRRAAFTIGGGGKTGGLVTLSNFPLIKDSMIDDPLQNLNMWRSAVGMPPATADDLPKVSEKTEIDGKPATFVRVFPDAPAEGGQAVLAAMVTTGDQVWFFKLLGDRGLVVAQEAAFKNFLKSVHFDAAAGSK